jgi:Ctr copper transporter family
MLAVMTMNVGYFLSVLAGTFVGELAVGRYVQWEEH